MGHEGESGDLDPGHVGTKYKTLDHGEEPVGLDLCLSRDVLLIFLRMAAHDGC
mgnify:CR=1 FL=1